MAFLEAAGSEWEVVRDHVYEAVDERGVRVRVAFGPEGLQYDAEQLRARADTIRAGARTREEDAEALVDIERLEGSMRALAARSLAGTMTDQGGLNGCSVGVGLNVTFNASVAMVDYGDVTLEASTQEFGPFGPGAGQVTLSVSAEPGPYVAPVTTWMGGFSSASNQAFAGPSWGCGLSASAYIQPACGVAGYRSVSWSTTCGAVVSGTRVTAQYGY